MWARKSCKISSLLLVLLATTSPVSVESLIDRTQGAWPHPKQTATAHELHTELLQKEDQTPTSTTTHKSWFERLGDAFTSVLAGLFLVIPFSVALLWVNEKRNAQLESLISLAQGDAEEITTTQKDLADYPGALVHLSGDDVKGLESVEDDRFPQAKYPSGCIKLHSVIEVFQWEEQEHTEKKKDTVGGGETTVTTYSYSKKWVTRSIDSSNFKDKTKFPGPHNCVNVKGLDNSNLGIKEKVNPTVKYGEPYWLKEDLVMQLSNYKNANEDIGKELKFSTTTFQYTGEYYQFPVNSEPEIGDVRVKIQCVKDGPATILALQEKDKNHADGYTFGPYRAVSRGCCGISDDELKKRRLDAAKMTADDLYEQDKCWDFGPFCCLCGCCNLVTWLFTHMQNLTVGGISGSTTFSLTPQIYSIWGEVMTKKACIEAEKGRATAKKWIIRLIGWFLLWTGFTMLFKPLEVFADIIPFVGPYLGTGISWVVGFLTFLLTVALSTLIVSCAYLIYNPLIGIMYAAFTVLVYAGIIYMGQLIKAKEG